MREIEHWSMNRLRTGFQNSKKVSASHIAGRFKRRFFINKNFYFNLRAILFAFCAAGILTIFSSSIFAQEFRVEGAGVEASPTVYNGACPGVITFTAKIQASGKGLVKYTWLRSDGATAPVEYLDFASAGVQRVSTTWTLGDARVLPNYNGWQQIKILSPNEYFSNKAEFKLVCSQNENPNGQAKPDLIVEWAKLKLGEVCRPYNPALYAVVKVKNIGTAVSPARSDVGLVGATDSGTTGWGNGVGLPALSPGASYTATIPIYYLISDPAYMSGRHNFEMRVNGGSWIEESNTGNNHYGPVAINIPTAFCAAR